MTSSQSQKKRSWWLYVVLVSMVLLLLGFFLLPLVSAFFQPGNSVSASTQVPGFFSKTGAQLEDEARGYELVLQREPENQTALRGLLEAKLGLGDIPGSIAPLEKLANLNPQETDYLLLLAQAKQQQSDYEGAARAYRQILAASPEDLNALQGMVNLYLTQNRPEAAIGLIQDSIKIATSSDSGNLISMQLLLGQVYANQKRYREAIAIYDRSIAEDSKDFRPVLAKALILQEQNKDEEAKPLFNTAASLAPAQYKDQIEQMAKKVET